MLHFEKYSDTTWLGFLKFRTVFAVVLTIAVLYPAVTRGGKKRPSESLPQSGEFVVGTDVKPEKITEFIYTYDASTNPPKYQKYRFYVENGNYMFYHEKRESDHWPLTENDITTSGSGELSKEDWASFVKLIKGGTVTKRKEHIETGSADPWMFLY